MQAIELVRSPDRREPAVEETRQILQLCYENGLIALSAGSYSNVIRVLAPLVLDDNQMEEGLKVLESALQTIHEPRGAVTQPL
jgi:4-aminobutyrate aminotransferase/(S)-3-amino-2-methylpropionate transaminase